MPALKIDSFAVISPEIQKHVDNLAVYSAKIPMEFHIFAAMKGTWKGFYIYGNGNPISHFGQRVNTSLELDEEDGEFKGKCIEEMSEFSANMESSIAGYFEENFVSFTLTYPEIPETLRDLTEDHIGKTKKLEVIYEGVYDEKKQAMYGTWVIPYFIQIELVETDVSKTGLWLLKKNISGGNTES